MVAAAEPLTAEDLRKPRLLVRLQLSRRGHDLPARNPLLRQPLKPEHIKKRLLGHWGTSPGLSFIYVHLNRLIKKYDLDAIFMAGPGHGAPGVLGPAYLEGTYSEVYPNKGEDEAGCASSSRNSRSPAASAAIARRKPRARSTRAANWDTPLARLRRRLRQPGPAGRRGGGRRRVGDRTARHRLAFEQVPQPDSRRGSLPILQLNGYKINNPTILARISHQELHLFEVTAGRPISSRGATPRAMHQQMATTLEHCVARFRRIQQEARETAWQRAARWPMIVLRSPKGWTGPKEVDGHKVEGSGAPTRCRWPACARTPTTCKQLEDWLRSYKPEELFDGNGRLIPELKSLAPTGAPNECQPARQRRPTAKPLRLPDFRDYAVKVDKPGQSTAENTRAASAASCATSWREHDQLPRLRPGRNPAPARNRQHLHRTACESRPENARPPAELEESPQRDRSHRSWICRLRYPSAHSPLH